MADNIAPIRQKKHRLNPEVYRGQVCVLYTACVEERRRPFTASDMVARHVQLLEEALAQCVCVSPLYCFMPDHLHVFITGKVAASDTRKAMSLFKQRSSFLAKREDWGFEWQDSFYDQVLRPDADNRQLTRYVIENPVRANLVEDWRDWPFMGTIGCSLDDTLEPLFYD